MEYTSKSSFLERGNKVSGVGFKSSGESRVASIFDQRYPELLLGKSSRDVAVHTILPAFYTVEEWSCTGMFGTLHEWERETNNARTQLLAKISLDV